MPTLPIVSLDLMEFIEQNILPRYTAFDKAHQLPHITRVIRRSLELASKIGADTNMAYVVAAYHDLGLAGPRTHREIFPARLWPKPTAIWIPTSFSDARWNMVWNIIPRKIRKRSGNASSVTWKTSIRLTATFGYGLPTLRMKRI